MTFNKHLVSVLIPAYNHENYIQDTIKSIISQTYKNIELIVVDDGSKDSTWEKILKIKPECDKRFSRVVFKTQENQGTCETFNRLLSLAQGEYVYIIASDDLAKPSAIEKEYTFLSNNSDYALCVGDNEIIDADSNICYLDKQMNVVKNKNEADFETFGQFMQSNLHFSFLSSRFGNYNELYFTNHIPNGYLIRRSVFDKTGYFTKEAPLEDYWLMLQISKYAKMKFLDEVLFSYRQHGANTVNNREKMLIMTSKTKEHEYQILKNADFESMLPVVKEVFENGYCYKRQGIPFIFEILTYRIPEKRVKIFKLFNIKIFQCNKDCTSV